MKDNRFSNLLKSTLLKKSGTYTVFSIINASIPVLLLPILTNKLTPSDYGFVSLYQLAFSFITPFVSLNQDASISVYYFEEDRDNFRKILSTVFVLIFLSFFLLFSIFQLNHAWLESYFGIQESLYNFIIFTALGNVLISLILVLFQVQSLPISYGIIQVSQTILNLALTYYLVVIINGSSNGRILAQTTTSISMGIISLLYIIKKFNLSFLFDFELARKTLKIGIPLIPHALGGMVFLSIDRLFLSKLIDLNQLGNYAVSYQICTLIFILTSSFNSAFIPWLFERLKLNDLVVNRKIVKLTYFYFFSLFGIGIVLFFSFPFIKSIFVKGNYETINIYSFFLLLGFIFQGLYFMVTNYFTYTKNTNIQALITLIIAILKLPISYFSINLMGPIGASFSYFITFFVFFLTSWYFSNKCHPMPWFYFLSNKK